VIHGRRWVQLGSSNGTLADRQNRERLVSLSSQNRAALDSISKSLLCLSLDSYTLPSIPTADPLINPSVDAQVRNGVAGLDGGRNRWLDKGTSIVVETNGRASLCGEHSPVDALIPSIVMDYVSKVPVDVSAFGEAQNKGEGWSRVDWVVDDPIKREIVECTGRNKKLIEDSHASQLWWAEYGVEWIKKHGTPSKAWRFQLTRSQSLPRRVHPASAPACMVQRSRVRNGNLRDRFDADDASWTNRCDPDPQCREQGVRQGHAGRQGGCECCCRCIDRS